MEHIDVTFGGRSVRLTASTDTKPAMYWNDDEDASLVQWRSGEWVFEFGIQVEFGIQGSFSLVSDRCPDPQSAVSAVESKLRDLRDQLNAILGE